MLRARRAGGVVEHIDMFTSTFHSFLPFGGHVRNRCALGYSNMVPYDAREYGRRVVSIDKLHENLPGRIVLVELQQ